MVGGAAAAVGKLTDRRIGRSCRLLSDPFCASTAEFTNGGRGVSMEAPVSTLVLNRSNCFSLRPKANIPGQSARHEMTARSSFFCGSSPEEAVARLWLALNQEPLNKERSDRFERET